MNRRCSTIRAIRRHRSPIIRTNYPSYYYPTAPYFAAFVTGAIWAAAIDWNDWGMWRLGQ